MYKMYAVNVAQFPMILHLYVINVLILSQVIILATMGNHLHFCFNLQIGIPIIGPVIPLSFMFYANDYCRCFYQIIQGTE
jgi:hypothetical protein